MASTALVPKLVQAAVAPSAVPATSKGAAAPAVMIVATPSPIVSTPPRIQHLFQRQTLVGSHSSPRQDRQQALEGALQYFSGYSSLS